MATVLEAFITWTSAFVALYAIYQFVMLIIAFISMIKGGGGGGDKKKKIAVDSVSPSTIPNDKRNTKQLVVKGKGFTSPEFGGFAFVRNDGTVGLIPIANTVPQNDKKALIDIQLTRGVKDGDIFRIDALDTAGVVKDSSDSALTISGGSNPGGIQVTGTTYDSTNSNIVPVSFGTGSSGYEIRRLIIDGTGFSGLERSSLQIEFNGSGVVQATHANIASDTRIELRSVLLQGVFDGDKFDVKVSDTGGDYEKKDGFTFQLPGSSPGTPSIDSVTPDTAVKDTDNTLTIKTSDIPAGNYFFVFTEHGNRNATSGALAATPTGAPGEFTVVFHPDSAIPDNTLCDVHIIERGTSAPLATGDGMLTIIPGGTPPPPPPSSVTITGVEPTPTPESIPEVIIKGSNFDTLDPTTSWYIIFAESGTSNITKISPATITIVNAGEIKISFHNITAAPGEVFDVILADNIRGTSFEAKGDGLLTIAGIGPSITEVRPSPCDTTQTELTVVGTNLSKTPTVRFERSKGTTAGSSVNVNSIKSQSGTEIVLDVTISAQPGDEFHCQLRDAAGKLTLQKDDALTISAAGPTPDPNQDKLMDEIRKKLKKIESVMAQILRILPRLTDYKQIAKYQTQLTKRLSKILQIFSEIKALYDQLTDANKIKINPEIQKVFNEFVQLVQEIINRFASATNDENPDSDNLRDLIDQIKKLIAENTALLQALKTAAGDTANANYVDNFIQGSNNSITNIGDTINDIKIYINAKESGDDDSEDAIKITDDEIRMIIKELNTLQRVEATMSGWNAASRDPKEVIEVAKAAALSQVVVALIQRRHKENVKKLLKVLHRLQVNGQLSLEEQKRLAGNLITVREGLDRVMENFSNAGFQVNKLLGSKGQTIKDGRFKKGKGQAVWDNNLYIKYCNELKSGSKSMINQESNILTYTRQVHDFLKAKLKK